MGINGDSKRKGCIAILIFVIAISANITFHAPSAMGSPVYVKGNGTGDFNSGASNNNVQIAQALKFGAENFDFKCVHLKSPSRYLTGYTPFSSAGVADEGDSDAGIRLIDEAGKGLFIPLMTNGFYNLMPANKPTSIISSLVVHVLFFVFCIGVVVAYANAGPHPLKDPSFRDAMKALLPLLFASFLLVLFLSPRIAPIYDTSDESEYVQISKESGIVTVKNEKGSVIYSGSDDVDAIETALNEIDYGDILFENGKYDIDRTIRLKSDISFIGNEKVTFNCFNGIAFDTGSGGYSSSTILLIEHLDEGDTNINLSSVAGLNVGDYIKISDDFSIRNLNGDTDYKNGEIVKIIAIDGINIEIDRPLYDSYCKTKNAKIRKISMFENITFKNINFVGYGIETSSTAIRFYGARNCNITNCEFSDFGIRATVFLDCLDCVIDSNTFRRVFYTGMGYGINIANACDNITITNNSFLELGRHYIAVGSNTGHKISDGFSRHITIQNNVFEDCADEAINTHRPNRCVITITDNDFYNCRKAIELSNSNSVIKNNNIVGCYATGIETYGTGSHLIEGNSFRGNERDYMCEAISEIKDNSFTKNS